MRRELMELLSQGATIESGNLTAEIREVEARGSDFPKLVALLGSDRAEELRSEVEPSVSRQFIGSADYRKVEERFGSLSYQHRDRANPGVGMLPVLDQVAEGPFGDAIFVTSDLAVGLLLQTRWMRESFRPLPIVLSHYSPQVQTLNLPDQLADRKRIFSWP